MKLCDYQCKLCNKIFEIKIPDNETFPQEIDCPDCKEKSAIRLYNPPSIHYNTSGFYSIDKGVK